MGIEKALYVHGLMIMGESEPFTSEGSLGKSEKEKKKKEKLLETQKFVSRVCRKQFARAQESGDGMLLLGCLTAPNCEDKRAFRLKTTY